MTNPEAFKALYETIAKLRSPEGCKWDREQTPSTLRTDLIEECYECIEAIDDNDPAHIAEELGDLFLLATMIAYIHEEEGIFSVADTLVRVNEKLIRRHPHVFADVKIKNTKEILDNWDTIKATQEGRKPKDSIMDEVSSGIPPMDRAFALQKKAAKAGFDWPDIEGVFSKIIEEIDEVKGAINSEQLAVNSEQLAVSSEKAGSDLQDKIVSSKIEEELGDLLFSAINLCRFLKIDPSVALRRTNSKFTNRFKYVEKKMKETGQGMNKENLDIMDEYWNESKSSI